MLKMKKSWIFCAILLAAVLALLAGCSGKAAPSPSDLPASAQKKTPTAAEIAADAIKAAGNITSFNFDMEMFMEFNMSGSGMDLNMKMQQDADGAVNLPEKEMALVMEMAMEMPGAGNQDMAVEIYTTGGWMYMKADVPGYGDQWTRMELTDEIWDQQSRMAGLDEFLQSAVSVELAGSETIGGVECYILDVNPDMNSLSNWMADQNFAGQSEADLSELDIAEMLEGFNIRQWIASDSYLPVRQQIEIQLNISEETGDAPAEALNRMVLDLDAVVNYSDYGKPVTIRLPSEALNALEVR